MRLTPPALCRAPMAALLAVGLAAAFVPPVLHAQAGTPDILTPRTPLLWSIQSADGQPSKQMNGEAMVGPDGTLELGPYGRVAVGGMTLLQAQAAAERQLARYLKQPRVSLRRFGAAPTAAPNYTEPASLANIGRVTPMAVPPVTPPTTRNGPVVIASSIPTAPPIPPMGGLQPVGAVEPITAEPPTGEVISENKPADSATHSEANSAPISGSTTGQWRPLVRENPTTPMPNLNSNPVVSTGVASTGTASNGGWQPLPRGPVQDSRTAQVEPGSDLRIYPRQVEPGIDPGFQGTMTGTVVDPMGAPLPHAPAAPHELARVSLPPYVIDPPDVLLIESTVKLPDQPIRGQHLVRPDGTISLGIYGSVEVRGMTLDQAKEAIARTLSSRIKLFNNDPEAARKVLSVDVLAYNSKFYYIVTDGGGYGEQVIRFPITGSETVLDAISQIGGLSSVASKQNIWVARTTSGHPGMQTLPVDWCGIVQRGDVTTNYQMMPNDRIYVKAKALITFDTALARVISPIERILGVTLLGGTTYNTIANRGTTGNGVP